MLRPRLENIVWMAMDGGRRMVTSPKRAYGLGVGIVGSARTHKEL